MSYSIIPKIKTWSLCQALRVGDYTCKLPTLSCRWGQTQYQFYFKHCIFFFAGWWYKKYKSIAWEKINFFFMTSVSFVCCRNKKQSETSSVTIQNVQKFLLNRWCILYLKLYSKKLTCPNEISKKIVFCAYKVVCSN